MKKFFSSFAGDLCLAILIMALLFGIFVIGMLCQPSQDTTGQASPFRDVTIELGSPLPPVEEFLTDSADAAIAKLVTPSEKVDLSKAGQQELVFSYDNKQYPVILTIQDTIAPVVTFRDVVTAIDKQPKPEDFVVEIVDAAATTVTFAEQPAAPETYGETQVKIRVTDASGNSVEKQCNLRYTWIYDQITWELGQPLEKSHLLLNPEKDGDLIDQGLLDEINASPVGVYTITSTSEGQTCVCTITVQDTTAPTLELKAVHIDIGERVTLNSFIKTLEDASGDVEVQLLTTLEDKKEGTQTVIIEATDINGNVTKAQTTLKVTLDSKAPVFSGASAVTLDKNSTFDFYAGVSAVDARDGKVSFTVDYSKVNLAKQGTYYAVYTAQDATGNIATLRRKIVINHDAEDTQALVNKIAAELPNDPEKIRDYVRNYVGYNSNWGGEDPVWYGFTQWTGNCYVHALCLQRIFDVKGYETQLIWVTDQSHYWLLINLDGVWRHIDATPGRVHSRYSLMTDAQRYATLSGRNWDRSQWPTCE